ncbi:hypothetical protein LRP52_42205 [Photobacterium sp. ZSDE20]|nr:hypothetical protein [Photobacterium sp. ZSDE20]
MNFKRYWTHSLSFILISLIVTIGPVSVLHQLEAVSDHHHATDCSICHIIHDSFLVQHNHFPGTEQIRTTIINTMPQQVFLRHRSPIARSPPFSLIVNTTIFNH